MICQSLETMIEAANPGQIHSKFKAITAFFPYAAQDGQHTLLNTFLRAARASEQPGFMWHWINPLIVTLLTRDDPVFLKEAAILALPHLSWQGTADDKRLIQLWAVAALTVPYTNEIGQGVAEALLQIASSHSVQQCIPIGMWSWLGRLPPLPFPPLCTGRHQGSAPDIVRTVQGLGDIEILKSYLFLVWSEWDCLWFWQDSLQPEQDNLQPGQDSLQPEQGGPQPEQDGFQSAQYSPYMEGDSQLG